MSAFSATALRAGVSKTPQDRAASAQQQLREYQALQRATLQKFGRYGTSQSPAPLELRINRSVQTASQIFFYTNIDSPATNLVEEGDGAWHPTTLNANSPARSEWCGVDSQQNYNTGAHVQKALRGTVDLTTAVGPVALMFAENFVTERGWDYCMVEAHASTGPVVETWLRGPYGSAPSGNSFGWQLTSLDLSQFAGQTIVLTFWFDTGDEKFNEFPGWFIDDIVVFDHAGTITGKKFFDVNNNGVKDIGERGVRDWRIRADGPISLTTRTMQSGRYRLPLPLGTYTVAEEPQPSWTQTYPPAGTWTIDLATPDTLVDSVHFGNYTQASFINGRIFADLDQDGIFNNLDTAMSNWLVTMVDSFGNTVNFDRSDSLGEYSLYVFTPGVFIVGESSPAGWVQTSPPGELYEVTIPDLNTVSGGHDFGNYYSPPSPFTSSIAGKKFNDRNRNGVWDDGEPPVAGFKIQLHSVGNGISTRTTDSTGYYEFLNLPDNTYTVDEVQQTGWWRSVPAVNYSVLITQGTHADTLNFGNYEIVPGSIGGVKYNDLNGNGVRDSGEAGLAGWRMELSGDASGTAYTDAEGHYLFGGLFPGSYTVAEVWRDGWRQTEPANMDMHAVNLGPEENFSAANFGNVADSAFAASFRTFTYDSLALAKDARGKRSLVKPLPDKVEFRALFVNTMPTPASRLTVRFSVPYYDSLHVDRDAFILQNPKWTAADITFNAPVNSGDTVVVTGIGRKPRLQHVTKWRWTREDLTVAPWDTTNTFALNIIRWPMPNAINVMAASTAGLKVGRGGPHSVVHPTYKEVLKTLADKPDRLHLGNPRCIDKFAGPTGKSIKKQVKYLNPTRHNNVLLGEAVALQVNIRASDFHRTPAGFGNLIYDEGTGSAMPLNNMSVREIAAALDLFMSSYNDSLPSPACTMPAPWAGLDVDTLYDRIRKINTAFSGPIDTASFALGLMLTGVREPEETGILRYDSSSVMRPGTYYTSPIVAAMPERLELYQNYPNPFNPTTTIEFYLPVSSLVTLKVYNMLGQEVAAIYDRLEMEDGYQDAEFDASSLGSGVYFYRLTAEGVPDEETGAKGLTLHEVRKMLLVK
jgi:hypothetical protein